MLAVVVLAVSVRVVFVVVALVAWKAAPDDPLIEQAQERLETTRVNAARRDGPWVDIAASP